jgi:hypothetical protein
MSAAVARPSDLRRSRPTYSSSVTKNYRHIKQCIWAVRRKTGYSTVRLRDLRFLQPWCCKSHVFWDVTPCRLVNGSRPFRGTWCFHVQGPSSLMRMFKLGFSFENEGTTIPRNVRSHSLQNTTLDRRSLESSAAFLVCWRWENWENCVYLMTLSFAEVTQRGRWISKWVWGTDGMIMTREWQCHSAHHKSHTY